MEAVVAFHELREASSLGSVGTLQPIVPSLKTTQFLKGDGEFCRMGKASPDDRCRRRIRNRIQRHLMKKRPKTKLLVWNPKNAHKGSQKVGVVHRHGGFAICARVRPQSSRRCLNEAHDCAGNQSSKTSMAFRINRLHGLM